MESPGKDVSEEGKLELKERDDLVAAPGATANRKFSRLQRGITSAESKREGSEIGLSPDEFDDLVAAIGDTAKWKFVTRQEKRHVLNQYPPTESVKHNSAKAELKGRLNSLTGSDKIKLKGMKVRNVNGGKLTVLGHLCVSKACPKGVSKILFQDTDVNAPEVVDGHRIPLLHLAAYCGNEAVVELLCKRKDIDFFARDSTNLTALHMGAKSGNETVFRCIYMRAYERFRHPHLPKTCDLLSPLVNGKDDLGMTPLHYATWEGSISMIHGLLQEDATHTQFQPWCKIVDVNASDDRGFTALHLASWHNHLGIVTSLLKHRNIDTSGRSGPLMRTPETEIDAMQYLRDQLDTMELESPLRQFLHNRQSPQSPCSFKEAEERKGWEGQIRKRAAHFLFPNSKLHDNEKLTALHCAARQGHLKTVAALVKKISSQERARTTLNALDKHGMSALHHAVIGGNASMIEELLSNPMVRGNVQEERRNLTPLNMAYILVEGDHIKGVEDLEEHRVEIVREYKIIIDLLSEQPDVKFYTQSLYRDRQLYVDAANAILVGAALIASITFQGWLQPPLGFQQYYEAGFLLTGSAPPDTYASYAAVGLNLYVELFWISNSLSFFFAIATVLIGACVVLPMVGKSELQLDVHRMRRLHIWTTLALSLSVVFVLGAFIAAGFASLPPRLEYQWGMIMTTATGGFVGLGALAYYLRRVIKLIKPILGAAKQNLKTKIIAKV